MNNEHTLYPLILSLVLHLFVVYFFFFGSPFTFRPLPIDNPVLTVEIVPISEKINIKNRSGNSERKNKQIPEQITKKVESTQKQEELKPIQQPAKNEKFIDKNDKIDAKNIEQPKQETVLKAKDESKVKSETKPESSTTMQNHDPDKDKAVFDQENPKTNNDRAIQNNDKKPVTKIIDAKPKQENKAIKELPKKKSIDSKPNLKELDDLLKSLEQSSDGVKDAKTTKRAKINDETSKKSSSNIFDEHSEETINYSSLIGQQIRENWNKPAGIIDKQFAIKFNIKYNQDGSLIDYKLIDKNCYELDQITCVALIDSVQRAIAAADPIKFVSANRYNEWNEINYTFVPDDN